MSKSMIEFHLNQLERGLTFQIVEQSDEITNYIKRVGTHYGPNGWQVKIDKEPEIDVQKKMIFLRGSKEHKDFRIDKAQDIGNQKETSKIASAIQKALEDACAAAKGARNKRPFVISDTFLVNLTSYDPYHQIRQDPRIIIING